MTTADKVKICARGAGCFYWLGYSDNPEAGPVGRPLCAWCDGHYDSGAGCLYVEKLAACPLGKWSDGAKGGAK